MNIFIHEPDHPITTAIEELSPRCIVGFTMSMRIPVNLNDQSTLMTIEISDIRPNHMLPAKLEAAKLSIAKTTP